MSVRTKVCVVRLDIFLAFFFGDKLMISQFSYRCAFLALPFTFLFLLIDFANVSLLGKQASTHAPPPDVSNNLYSDFEQVSKFVGTGRCNSSLDTYRLRSFG